jgi:hypothetical protein
MIIMELDKEEFKQVVQKLANEASKEDRRLLFIVNTFDLEGESVCIKELDKDVVNYCISKFSILKSKRNNVAVVNLTGKVNQILSFISSNNDSGNDNEDGEIVVIISNNYCIMIEDDKELKLNRY